MDYLKELSVLLKNNKTALYEAALQSSDGDTLTAQAILSESVYRIACIYKNLNNKESAIDLCIAKIKNTVTGRTKQITCQEDIDVIIDKAIIRRIRTSRNKRNIILCVCIVSVLCVSVLMLSLRKPEKPVQPTDGVMIMDDTETIIGNKSVFTAENYQALNKMLDKSARTESAMNAREPFKTMADVVTCPDGSIYTVYQNVETENGENVTFSLYKAEKAGWKICASGDLSPVYCEIIYGRNCFNLAPVIAVCDDESNVYTVTTLDKKIAVYSYNTGSQVMSKTESDEIHLDYSGVFSLSALFDASLGLSGSLIIPVQMNGKIVTAVYDIQTDTFYEYCQRINSSATDVKLYITDSYIYLLCDTDNYGINLIIIDKAEKTVTQKKLFTSSGILDYEFLNDENGNGGIIADCDGMIHIFTTYMKMDNTVTSTGIHHYALSADGELVSDNILDRLVFPVSAYKASFGGAFIGNDSTVYYVEIYKGAGNVLAIGALDKNDAVITDSIELKNNIDISYTIKNKGNDFLFYSGFGGNDRYMYFSLREAE